MAYTDRFPIVTNFFETRLTADCEASDTTLYLEDVSSLPSIIVGRDYVPMVLRDAGTGREIVYVTAVDFDSGSVTAVRGEEGTIALRWGVGSYMYCTMTAASLQCMRVNGFTPLVDSNAGRPAITRLSATSVRLSGDWTDQLEVGMAVRVLSGDTVVEPTDDEVGAIHIASVVYSGGVTTLGFQNVSFPSVVSSLDLGISTASAPMYHPDTIVADGVTTSQVGNVISADLAQATAISTAAADATSKANAAQSAAISAAATDATQKANAAQSAAISAAATDATTKADAAQAAAIADATKYLPKSGGAMTGAIYQSGNTLAFKDADDSYLGVYGCTGYNKGARLILYGKDHASSGLVQLNASNGSQSATLNLYPDGSLTSSKGTVLTSAGGQVNGALTRNGWLATGSSSSSFVGLTGGVTADGEGGSGIFLYGKDNSDGLLRLRASNGTSFADLLVFANGTATLNGNSVLTSAGGSLSNKLTFSSARAIDSSNTTGMWIVSESLDSAKTSSLGLFPVSHTNVNRQGAFELTAGNGTTGKKLVGHYTNGLMWDDSPVLTLVASWRDGDNWYRKWSDGWIEQGGLVSITSAGQTVLLHTPFTTTNYTVVTGGATTSHGNTCAHWDSRTTTSFTAWTSDDESFNAGYLFWYACGY